MRTQILLLTLLLGTFGCSSAQMVIDKDLVSKSDQYEISERPGAFTKKGKLIFGPYMATEIYRSFIGSSSSGLGASGVGSFSVDSKGQKFTYSFKGSEHWTASCEVRGSGISIGNVISAKEKMGVFCNFLPAKENRRTENRAWNFDFEGQDLISATGFFKVGSKTVSVVGTNKFEGSSLPYGKPTGYYFYVKGKVVAGVDVINKKGPVWIEKNLSADEKDAIGLVSVVLLLNQV